MRTWATIISVALLAGCATTPEERAARVQADVDQMIAAYGPGCEKLGYKPNDDKWRDCVLRLATRDERRYPPPVMTSCIGHRGFFNCTTF